MRRAGPYERPRIVICRCRSHCTTFNPATGNFEGNGQPQTRATRDNHVRDDRILAVAPPGLPAANAAAPQPLPTHATVPQPLPPQLHAPNALPSQALAPQPTWIQQALLECQMFMSLPLSHPARPFVFINPPELNGPFIWPPDNEILHPNTGMYALAQHRSNQMFLFVAHHVHTLLVNAWAQPNPHSDQLSALVVFLRQRMSQLMRFREIEWSQQRGSRGIDVPYVNTGG